MRGRGGGGGGEPGNSNAMIRAPLPTPPLQKQAKAGPRGAGGRGHIPRGSTAGPLGARAAGCEGRVRAREAGAEALGRAAAGARHRRSGAAAAAAAPGPASPRQHRSLFTSRVPAALPPATRAAAAAASPLLRAPTRATPHPAPRSRPARSLQPQPRSSRSGERATAPGPERTPLPARPRQGGAPSSRPFAAGGPGGAPPLPAAPGEPVRAAAAAEPGCPRTVGVGAYPRRGVRRGEEKRLGASSLFPRSPGPCIFTFSRHLPTQLLGFGSKIEVAGLAKAERTANPPARC